MRRGARAAIVRVSAAAVFAAVSAGGKYARELEVAADAVRLACGMCQKIQLGIMIKEEQEGLDTKKDKSLVTTADYAAKAIISRRASAQRFVRHQRRCVSPECTMLLQLRLLRQTPGYRKHNARITTFSGARVYPFRALAEAFPADLLVAEEETNTLNSPAGAPMLALVTAAVSGALAEANRPAMSRDQILDSIQRGQSPGSGRKGRHWVLDPVDGTFG